jgi:peptidoglycan hydrolase-like protein with peptidoglycan-binding domain
MASTTMKFGLVAFVLLAGAAVTNVAVLQPHTVRIATASRKPDAPARKPEPAVVRGDERPPGATREAVTRPAVSAPSEAAASSGHATADIIRSIQRELKDKGYDPGGTDGQPGLMTRAAIMAYEADRGLPLTAEPTQQLLKTIQANVAPAAAGPRGSYGGEQSVQATHVIRTVQQSLVTLGYVPGKVDGRMGDDTVRAIREFELDQRLPETGRVSGQLMARLTRLAGQGKMISGR